ncbi:class I SAM-dependent methyltransferase [bacterium]|nr:class I SAM-dependent methyltransferase [bacterium]
MNDKVYRRFAEVYDTMGADRFSAQMVEYTGELIHKFNIDVVHALDLCCGTGTALHLFARKGWQLVGVDRSEGMLKIARKKLRGTGAKLYQKSLPTFKIALPGDKETGKGFDLVTSFYDSLNYLLTQRDLKATFRTVHAHLKPGGWFVFDMNTAEALKVLWDGQVFADVHDNLAWVWKNTYDENKQTADCAATFFVRKGKVWERFTEVHTERAYANSVIRKLLRESGFVVRGLYRCFSFEKPDADDYRVCVVAEKKR